MGEVLGAAEGQVDSSPLGGHRSGKSDPASTCCPCPAILEPCPSGKGMALAFKVWPGRVGTAVVLVDRSSSFSRRRARRSGLPSSLPSCAAHSVGEIARRPLYLAPMSEVLGDGHQCEISDGEPCIHCGVLMTEEEGITASEQPDWMID